MRAFSKFDVFKRVRPSADTNVPVTTNKLKTNMKTRSLFMTHLRIDLLI